MERVSAYAQAVLDGGIVAGPHVRNACRRHFDDLEKGASRGIRWDDAAARRVFNFFERKLRLSEGQFDNQPFILQPMQEFILGSIFGWKRADGTRRFRRAYIEAGKGCGKALAMDTAIPTPNGWTTMGEIRPGDTVFDERGLPTEVLGVSDVMENHDVYEVVFDDGERIVADAEHLWFTEMRKRDVGSGRGSLKGEPKSEWGAWRRAVRTTKEIAETLRYPNGKYLTANHSIDLTSPLALPAVDLEIEPYTLGAWLGDGDSDCARITCADADIELLDNLRAAGCAVGTRKSNPTGTAGRYRIGSVGVRGKGGKESLNAALRAAGLLGNKHIPVPYLRASTEQRLALLQGLMDTDGHIDDQSGRCEFTTIDKEFANQVAELCHTLGLKVAITEGRASINGRDISAKWRVFFNAPHDLPVFRLKRKLERQAKRHNRRRLSGDRKIVECRRVKSVPVKCIRVASPNSLFLAGRGMVPTHNSPLVGGIGLYGLVYDDEPGAQIYAAAATKDQASILFRDAVKMMRQSPDLSKKVKPSGGFEREYNIAYHKSQSYFRPMSREAGKTGSGLRPHFALCDEVHEHPGPEIMRMLEAGFKFRRQPLMVMITNSGSDRLSVCWREHEMACAVAAGTQTPDDVYEYVGETWPGSDEHFSYVCALDKDDDPFEDDSCWIKTNPLLGVTVTKEYIASQVAFAKNFPSDAPGILRLYFCVWTDAHSSWMPRKTVESVMAEFDIKEHEGKPVFLGVDLSRHQDLTCVAYVVPTGHREMARPDGTVFLAPTFDAWVDSFTPADTLKEREDRDKAPYSLWVKEGYIQAIPGERIRYDYVAYSVAQADKKFDIKAVAYDNYAYAEFKEACGALGLELVHRDHPQGGLRRNKPDEALVEQAKAEGLPEPGGLWMPGSIREVESMIIDGRIRLRANPVLMTAMMAATFSKPDPLGNKYLVKESAHRRIDPAVALCMAVGAAVDGAAEPQDMQDFVDNMVVVTW